MNIKLMKLLVLLVCAVGNFGLVMYAAVARDPEVFQWERAKPEDQLRALERYYTDFNVDDMIGVLRALKQGGAAPRDLRAVIQPVSIHADRARTLRGLLSDRGQKEKVTQILKNLGDAVTRLERAKDEPVVRVSSQPQPRPQPRPQPKGEREVGEEVERKEREEEVTREEGWGLGKLFRRKPKERPSAPVDVPAAEEEEKKEAEEEVKEEAQEPRHDEALPPDLGVRRATGNPNKRIYVCGDIEGDWNRVTTFLSKCPYEDFHIITEDNDPQSLENIFTIHLADDAEFVFLGDSIDKKPYNIKVLKFLLKMKEKEKYPGQVTLIMGNRDINKLRLLWELKHDALDLEAGDVFALNKFRVGGGVADGIF